jgi:hypothetical protein
MSCLFMKPNVFATTARELTQVDISSPLWAAMVFLAVLAYPESTDRRDRAILAMKAWVYRAARSFNKPVGSDSASVFAAMPVQQQNGTLRRLSMRLDKRLIAGSVASQLVLHMHKPGRIERIAPSQQQRTRQMLMTQGIPYAKAVRLTMQTRTWPGKLFSLNDYAKRYPGGSARFKNQVWRPEILHLALAFHSTALGWRDPLGFNIFRLLANPQWILNALNVAELNAEMLKRLSNLPAALYGFRSTPLIRLLPFRNRPVEISKPATSK